MQLSDLLSPDCTKCAVEGASKKRLLETISAIAAPKLVGITKHDIFESLINRERLGSTGYEVKTTPFGWFCEWDLSVYGESLAKVWKEI